VVGARNASESKPEIGRAFEDRCGSLRGEALTLFDGGTG
jgi:hypothetical protein